MTREPIHWVWLPPAAIYTVAIWIRNGALLAIATVVGGISLGLWVRHRASKRK